MHFDERKIGDYRVFAGALEGLQGDGYIAALIVQRELNGIRREVMRDESLACGHRWQSPDAALAYAINKGRDVIRQQQPTPLPC